MEDESDSMEEYEKYLQDAKFIMKNKKYFYKEKNDNNNFLGINDNDNINLFSSVATASFNKNNLINSPNKNYLSNSIEDNKINNFLINNEVPINSSTNNNIKGSVISMKDIFLSKSSSLKIKDSNNIEENIDNNKNINIDENKNINIDDNPINILNNNQNYHNMNNNINNIKILKEEISKIKFQIKICRQKYAGYEKIYNKLKNLHKENDLNHIKLNIDFIKQENDLKEKYNLKKESIFNEFKIKDKDYNKKINILKTKLQILKEKNYNLRKKLSSIKEENKELEKINNMREYELKEQLFCQENEINKIKNNITNLKQQYSMQEEENENILEYLHNQINEGQNLLNNIKNNFKNYKIYKPGHKKTLSSINKCSINISENNENQSIFSESWNKYNILKIRDFKEKIQNYEKEIVDLNLQISKKSERNEKLIEEINELRDILKNKSKKIIKNDIINDKYSAKKAGDLELMMNRYENNYYEIIKAYNLRIIEQNDEKNKIITNYESKIKNLINKIKKMQYEIYT